MTRQKTLAGLSVLVQEGKLDPVTLAEQTLAGIAAHGDQSIFVGITRERALKEASAASARLRAGRSCSFNTRLI